MDLEKGFSLFSEPTRHEEARLPLKAKVSPGGFPEKRNCLPDEPASILVTAAVRARPQVAPVFVALIQAVAEEEGSPSSGDPPQPHVQGHEEHDRQSRQQNPAQRLDPAASHERAMQNSLHGRGSPIELDVARVYQSC